jgi:hypothetical protein
LKAAAEREKGKGRNPPPPPRGWLPIEIIKQEVWGQNGPFLKTSKGQFGSFERELRGIWNPVEGEALE